MALFLEDTKEVTQKQIPIPQNAKKVFKAMKKVYEPYLDKPIQGAKILKSLANDKEYNTKGIESKTSLKNNDTISVDDAKTRLKRQNKLAPNSIEYQLYGGDLAHNILKKGIENARSVQAVDKVRPPKPTAQNATKPSSVDSKEINKPNGKIKIREDKKIIKEDSEHIFYDYLGDYDAYYVIHDFIKSKGEKQTWTPLINPEMYVKALREFTQYGRLMHFPRQHVYRWMGIIMRNTAKLIANTELAGHSGSCPLDAIEDAIPDLIGYDRDWEIIYQNNDLKYEISKEEFYHLCDEKGMYVPMQEAINGIHKNGQYDLFMNQKQVDDYDARQTAINNAKNNQNAMRPIIMAAKKLNERLYNCEGRVEVDNNGKIYRIIDIYDFLEQQGLYDWMQMPDGSDAWSDYGIQPLTQIIAKYNKSLTPEETLVLINKALDVVHQRGDIASIFIEGGSKTLSRISESINNLEGKKIYLTEKQIAKLCKLAWKK
jgi:hypothetical protein